MPDKVDITYLAEEKKAKRRERIADLCKRSMTIPEKDEVCKLALDSLKENGSFYSSEGSLLYFHKSSGELIDLHHRKRDLAAILSKEFSLNSNDAHTKRVMESVRNHAHNFAIDVQLHSLARYDSDSDTLFLHVGNGNVLQVTIDAEPIIVQMSARRLAFSRQIRNSLPGNTYHCRTGIRMYPSQVPSFRTSWFRNLKEGIRSLL